MLVMLLAVMLINPGVGIGPIALGQPLPDEVPFSVQTSLEIDGKLVGVVTNTGGSVVYKNSTVGGYPSDELLCSKPELIEGKRYETVRAVWVWMEECGLAVRLITDGQSAVIQAFAVFIPGSPFKAFIISDEGKING